MTGRRPRLLCGALGAALLLAAGGSLLLPASAGADEPPAEVRSLVAGASAQGMRMGYSVPDQFAVSQFIDGGGPVAQTSVDSTGKAIGFGSLPYPGETAVAAPGALTLVSGQPIPGYPFYAEASYPVTPKSEVRDPTGNYVLSATAEAQEAEGLAAMTFGPPGKPVARVVSTASGRIDPAGATVTATSIGEGFSFGDGILTIASGTSRSTTTYRAAGAAKPETKNELSIVGAKVGDQAVTIGPDGVHPLGQSFDFPGGAEPLNQALAAAGITVRTLSSKQNEAGASTEALQVVMKHPIPGSNVEGTFVYEFGGSTSFIAFGAAGPGLPPLPDAGPGGGGAATPAIDVTTPPAANAEPEPSATGAAAELDLSASGPDSASVRLPLASSSPLGGSSLRAGSADRGLPAGGSAEVGAPSGGPVGPSPSLPIAAEPVVLARPDLKQPGRVLMAVLAGAGAVLLAASTFWRKAL